MRVFKNCPKCGSPLEKSITYLNTESEFWLQCSAPSCKTYVNTYVPQPHQRAVHEDPHTYTGNFGAYGTGKTLTSREEIYKHIFLTPKGNILVGANIAAQYDQTIKRDIEMDLPQDFFVSYNARHTYHDLYNGTRLMFRPFDDPDKLRSLNLSMFVIVEASEVKGDTFSQLKTRLRNLAAAVQETDPETGSPVFDVDPDTGMAIPVIKSEWRKGIIESNPDSGWIRTDLLLNSSEIYTHGDVASPPAQLEHVKDPAISSHVASTDVNKWLPASFIPELCKNKPAWWVAKFVKSSFNYSEGLVYPNAPNCVCDPFPIPKHWKRLVVADYGLSDKFVYLFTAVDQAKGIAYVYKVVSTSNRNMDDLADMYFEETKDIPLGGIFRQILDPKSLTKRDYNKISLADHFLERGIYWEPGAINITARVLKTNTYIESGRLKIFSTCHLLLEELGDYKFPEKTLDGRTKGDPDKPVDKNNHAINPLEWTCMALPDDPRDIIYGVYVNDRKHDQEQFNHTGVPHALQDTYDDDPYSEGAYGIGGIY